MLAAFSTPLAVAEPDFGPLQTPTNQYKDYSLEKQARIKGFEDQILEKSLSILNDSLGATDIEGDELDIPQEWIDEAKGDMKRARTRFRIAKANWKTGAEAPAWVRLAQHTALGIIKARATEKAGPRILNVGHVTISSPMPEFPVIDVEPNE